MYLLVRVIKPFNFFIGRAHFRVVTMCLTLLVSPIMVVYTLNKIFTPDYWLFLVASTTSMVAVQVGVFIFYFFFFLVYWFC